MEQSRPHLTAAPKPINVFYVWYTELCRRLNCTPTPIVKPAKPKCTTVLDFVADRLKLEEWHPIVAALKLDTSLHVIRIKSRVSKAQFLFDVDTEEKAKQMKRKFGTIWTDFVLKSLLKSMSASLRTTQVLTCLELDGLPMYPQYLETLLQALKKNTTLKLLSLANSAITDKGCMMICNYVRFTPNIEIINLSGCNLTEASGEPLAKLIKYQQINRYCESWHNSLRYETPQSDTMRGLKRITLNSNLSFGDQGLLPILDELEDDLWIKALDLQKCGITDAISNKILQVINYNKSLEIMDLRQNEYLDITVLDKVLQVLKERQFQTNPEYQWCNTALSLTWSSIDSKTSISVHKSQSAPIRSPTPTPKVNNIRKSKTSSNVKELKNELAQKRKDEVKDVKKKEVDKKKKIEMKVKKSTLNMKLGEKEKPKPETNGFKNGYKNGHITSQACKILEKIINRDQQDESESEEDLLDYFLQSSTTLKGSTKEHSGSQVSLYNFMEELKNGFKR